MSHAIIYIVATMLLVPAAVNAATIIVDQGGGGDYPTIQAALDAAVDTDRIQVNGGTYVGSSNRNLTFAGKDLRLEGMGGPEATIIDAQGLDRCVRLTNSEPTSCVIEGFTFRNGSADDGAGMYLINAGPTIRNCIFRNNVAGSEGGGIYASGGNGLIEDCRFENNSAEYGGGAYCYGSAAPDFDGCTFESNQASYSGGGVAISYYCQNEVSYCVFFANQADEGGALDFLWDATTTVSYCTISYNTAASAGGGIHNFGSNPVIDHTIIAHSSSGEGIWSHPGMNPGFEYCLCAGNDGGNDFAGTVISSLQVDPEFCGTPSSGLLTLQSDSPCLAAVNPFGEHIGALGQGCQTTDARTMSWGRLKAEYR
ncbi:MAG: hypothetical protein ABIF77_00295 [bacterium]